jgi:cytoskeletal protein CcmA (bactofilin family)
VEHDDTTSEATVRIIREAGGFGDVTAHRVMVAGKVEGNIYASERVEFHKDSVVHGDIAYGSIAVEHGARLLGLVIQNPVGGATTGAEATSAIRQAQNSK